MRTAAEEARQQMEAHWRYRCEQAEARGEPLPPRPTDAPAQSTEAQKTETVPLWRGLTVTRTG
jgi:hypothetical protein